MNSFSGSNSHRAPSSATGASFDSYQFDFGIAGSASGSGSRPIKDQKPSPHAAPASRPSATPAWSHQPSRPSWTPAVPSAAAPARSGKLGSGPSSMVGDIFGKSWASPASSSGVGIPKSDPNLFSDLVGSALGQGRGGSGNVPLKSAAPRNTFSMGNLSDSLPKPTTTTSASAATASSTPIRSNSWGSTDNSGNFSSFNQSGPKIGASVGGGGQPMKSVAGVSPASTKRDPFGSLFDIGSKPSMKQPSSGENLFNMSSGSTAASANVTDFSFGAFQNANPTKMGDHGKNAANFSSPPPPQQPTAPASGTDPLDMFFSPSAPSPAPGVASEGPGSQQFSEMNDWDMSSDFGGNNSGGATTEIDGLPPPPSGVTAPAAKTKGQDNYKQGQYADAIKWLSWAVVLLERSGDKDSMAGVLSCRASCYKEVGEYKKAVADCSKVLDKDTANVSMLVQRALLYESMEKYRLGAEDLRTVLKIDPGNRIARSTIHRLNKFAD